MRDRRRNIEKIQQTVVKANYQSLHHFLTESPWDHHALAREVGKEVNQFLGGSSDTALLIDPSSFAKKGNHSVGVARQYSGRLGKVDNCQIGVFAAMVNGSDASMINHRLYLPKVWGEDPVRCHRAGIPEEA